AQARRLLLDPFLSSDGELARLLVQLRAGAEGTSVLRREVKDRLEVMLGLAPEQVQFGGAALAHLRLQSALPGIALKALALGVILQMASALLVWRSPRAALWLPLPGLIGAVICFGAMAA